MRRISILNQKGGVGKSTIAFHLGGALAGMGYRTLVADCDSQGSVSFTLLPTLDSFRYSMADVFGGTDVSLTEVIQSTPFDGLDLIPADERLDHHDRTADYEEDAAVQALAEALTEVEDTYDFVLFDCPPRRSLTAYATLVAADDVLVPIECDVLSLQGIVKIHEKIDDVRERLNPRLQICGYVPMRFEPKAALQQRYLSKLRKALGEENVFTPIRKMRTFPNAMSYNTPVTLHAPKSQAAAAMRKLAKEIIQHDSHAEKNKNTAA